MDIAEQKNILRNQFKSKISAFMKDANTPEVTEGFQESINKVLSEINSPKTMGVYSPLTDEVDWRPFLPMEKFKLGFPVIDSESKSMEYFTTSNSVGELGVSLKDSEKGDKVEPEVLLIPGLAFDEQGFRLGRGGGYYDRLLAGFNGVKIGIVYSCSYNGELPRLDHDKPVDYIVTEKACFKINR